METSTRATVGLILLVGVFLTVAVLGIAPGAAAQESNATDGNVTFGAQVSAFMQSTAADANGTVDRGMWRQSVENTSSPDEAVSDRVSRLERRVDELEARNADLAATANESGVAGVVYTARASAVRAELSNLRASVDQTAETASNHGVDDERLADLQERAGSVSGPEVAEAARTLTDGSDSEPGPPTDSPGADTGNGTDAGGPSEGGPPDDRGNGGPPDDRGDGLPDDRGDGGPPDDAGNGGPPDDAGGGDGGSGDAGGNGNDNAGGNDDSGNEDAGNGGSNGGGSDNGGSNSGGSNSGGPGNSGGGSGNSDGNAGGGGPGGNGGPS